MCYNSMHTIYFVFQRANSINFTTITFDLFFLRIYTILFKITLYMEAIKNSKKNKIKTTMYLNDLKFSDDLRFRYLYLSGLSVNPFCFAASSTEYIIQHCLHYDNTNTITIIINQNMFTWVPKTNKKHDY